MESAYKTHKVQDLHAIWYDKLERTEVNNLDMVAYHWRNAPRRWGHPFHSLCSYFAMFPPQVPRVFIEWLSAPGEVVYDPFCGRGTAPLEACRLGRIGLGSDANPLASVLTGAKVNPPTLDMIQNRVDELRYSMPLRKHYVVPSDIEMLYAPKTLRQLCWLRAKLDISDRTDLFIMSTVLGMLHANYKPGFTARGFSISMPNTFSMSSGYVRKYINEHNLRPPDVDVFDMVLRKIQRMALPEACVTRGAAWKADARTPNRPFEQRARLVFTSPPYLGVIKYGKYNWIRLWMLGHQPKDVDGNLVSTSSLRRYVDFMREVLQGMADIVASHGYLCLMIGDVTDKSSGLTLNLSETVWKTSAQPSGWRRLGIINDYLPQQHKVSRIWGHEKKGGATKVDRILILAPPGTRHGLPPIPRSFSWISASTWAHATTEEM